MFSSLRWRLWLTYALIVGVVICIAGAAQIIYLLRNPTEARQELQRLRLISAILIQREGSRVYLSSDAAPDRLQEVLKRGDTALGVRLMIQDARGQIIADSRPAEKASPPVLQPVSELKAGDLPVFRDERGRAWLYAARRLEGGNLLVVASLYSRIPFLVTLRNEFAGPFVRATILALFLALLLAFWISRWIAAPLQRMAQAARTVSVSESFAQFHPLPLEGPGEAQTLAQALNEMAGRVQASQQSQRDFVANVSHELKTPLTSIQGFAQAILDGAADTPQARKQAAEVIYSEAGRMNRLVMDLLDLVRLDAGIAAFEWRQVDLAALLSEVEEKLYPVAIQAQVDLRFSVDRLEPVVGDGDRLEQVFINLVDNAVKFTPAGGQVRLHAEMIDEWVTVSVSDSGPGIPTEELERIFERFYQTDKSRRGGRRGVGLGLAIAREIVQAHKGTISASNLPGQGAIFVVKLPHASRLNHCAVLQ